MQKSTIKKIFQMVGLEVRRFSAGTNYSLQLLKCLDHLDIDLILDVGANKGQFASEMRSVGYSKAIISFEPLIDAHKLLSKQASADSGWKVYKRVAIGNECGETTLNVSENSVSSSILQIRSIHVDAAHASKYVSEQSVEICRLDEIYEDITNSRDRVFLKIDTQGFEIEVLKGAENSLKNISGVVCELSLEMLYSGQAIWKEVCEYLESKEFILWGIQPGFTDLSTGRTLQFDGIFIKRH